MTNKQKKAIKEITKKICNTEEKEFKELLDKHKTGVYTDMLECMGYKYNDNN